MSMAATAPASSSAVAARPLVGLLAVFLGAFISTLTGRLSSFGLADIRGAIGAGFDDGAWITTAQSVGQMVIGPVAVWAASVYGTRRVLLGGCLLFAACSLLIPVSASLVPLLIFQFLGGLGSGCFVPLTVVFVLRNLSPRYWALGIAVYALNLETSLNISASIEGWYVDHLSWQWIFWQNVPLGLAMATCVWFGVPAQAMDRSAAARSDYFGLITAALAFALLYAAFDQGNRLDWLNSGLILGLLTGGLLLLSVFLWHEAYTPSPWINLKMLGGGYLPILLLLVTEVRFASLATAYLIPQFLVTVRGFRAPEVGGVLAWIAVPQLIAAPLAAFMLRRADARVVCGVGLLLIGLACACTASALTVDWSNDEFLPWQLTQGLGQTLAISAAIFIGSLRLRPADAATFGALLQIARLFGGEMGLAVITTLVRKAEQTASAIVGEHVRANLSDSLDRLRTIGQALTTHGDASGSAVSRATGLLAQAVRTQANLVAYVHAFSVVCLTTFAALLLLCLLGSAPVGHPAIRPSRWALEPRPS